MEIGVGRLGRFVFDPGWYIYTGSAMTSLASRLARHCYGPASGKLHWHIDYLAPHGNDKAFKVLLPGIMSECELNRAVGSIPGAVVPVKQFGSSDCACHSHLHRLPRKSWLLVAGLAAWRFD